MKPIAMLGLALIVLGIAGLVVTHVSWTETKPLVDVGPIHIASHEDHTVWIPTIAAVMAVLAGLGLFFAGKRSV